MKNNRLLIGGVALVFLLGITALLIRNRDSVDAGTGASTVALPHIDKATVDTLEITRPNGDHVKLAKNASGEWRLVEPVDARADQTNVTTALDKLAELEVTGIAATRAENHIRLEVEQTKGVHVIARTGANVVADLWIGMYRGARTMVRKEGDTNVASVQGSIRSAFDRATKDWRHRLILETTADAIGEISFASPNGAFHFRKEGTAWAPAADQAAIERFVPTKVGAIVASLARVRATDFGDAALTPEQTGLDATAPTVTLTLNGEAGVQQVMFRIGKVKEGGNNERYFQREGDPVVYIVTGFLANKLQPNLEAFQGPADGGVAAAPEDDEPPPMPMGAMGGAGGQQIPPEIMRQLQEQMRQRGMQQPPH